jgi:hypothetical protein
MHLHLSVGWASTSSELAPASWGELLASDAVQFVEPPLP